MNMSAVFSRRDFGLRIDTNGLLLNVDQLSWQAQGGCDWATILAGNGELAPAARLWNLLEYLRCPVMIKDDKERSTWWGFVNDVTVQVGQWKIGATLDGMANRVIVLFSYIDVDSTEKSSETGWAEDAASVLDFGKLEYTGTLGNLTSLTAAEGKRDVLLQMMYKPQNTVAQVEPGISSAEIHCRGWMHSLKWRMAWLTTSGTPTNTAHIANLITEYGEFITGLDLFSSGTITTPEVHTGENRVYTEIVELLELGGTNERRLLANVDEYRRMQIREEDASTAAAEYYLDKNGLVHGKLDQVIPGHLPPVGKYIRLRDVIPATVDVTKINDPTLQFVEGAFWSATDGLKLQFRGQTKPEDLLRVQK